MSTEQIDQIILANANKIDLDSNETIRQRLVGREESEALTAFAELKSPTTVLLVSIFLGSLGIDRFILGQKFLGVLKLITAGGCFIWTIIDWFTSGDRTRTYNTRILLERLRSLEIPAVSKAPEVSVSPETSVAPESPEVSVAPETSVAPESPEVSVAPETSVAPESPEISDAPESPVGPTLPKTAAHSE